MSLYVNSLPSDARVRYEKKLAICGLKTCPYMLPSTTAVVIDENQMFRENMAVYELSLSIYDSQLSISKFQACGVNIDDFKAT